MLAREVGAHMKINIANTARLLILAPAILAGGCVLTLNSLFTSKDVVYDPALVGIWHNAEATFAIKAFDKRTGRYVVRTSITNQPPGEFYATLGTIGTKRFLEFTPQRPDAIHQKSFFGGHFLHLNSFWKVGLSGDQLTLIPMSIQWLDTMIKNQKVSIKHEDGGVLFLTATTQELQEFVAKYADDPGAFPSRGGAGGTVFVRSPVN